MIYQKEQTPKKYVLTGGPSSGKSSMIIALEMEGDYIIKETAEDYIKLRQAQGIQRPWTESDFQDKILKLQLQRESRIPSNIKRIFMDRSLIDGLVYEPKETDTYARIMQESKKTKYEKIFLIKPIGFTEKTIIRKENYEETIEIDKKLDQIYKKLGYQPIEIASGHLEKRVQEILQNI